MTNDQLGRVYGVHRIITQVIVSGGVFATDIDDAFNCRTQDATELLSDLIQEVISLDLQKGISTSFDAKLQTVLAALEDVDTNNDIAALNSLDAFINATMAQSGNSIMVDEANALIDSADAIRAKLALP